VTEAEAGFNPSPHMIEKIKIILERLVATNQIENIMAFNPLKSTSFQAQVNELQPGESCSKVRAVDPTTPVSRLPDELPSLRQQVRNTITPAVRRATETSGSKFTIEVGDVVMPAGRLYIVGIVTRLPD
jgi:hypothetical protein